MRALTTLEYALLGLIRQQPRSGYELRKQFATTPLGHYSDSPGSIYPALARLRHRGLLQPISDAGGNPRRRQRFGLTSRGERELRAWLRRPIEGDDVIHRMDALLLRFAFLAGSQHRAAASRFLLALERQISVYLAELRKFLKTMPPAAVVARLALEHGIAGYRASAQWARHARRKIERRSS